jgi:xylose isomerase
MKEWLRFSVCYWHTFRGTGADPFGAATLHRPWEDGSNSIENAKRRLSAAFEFMSKLGVEYWTFHDRDIAPEGKSLEESNAILDEIVEHALALQKKYGIKLLWGTQNLFSHPRYANGALTNPDAHVFAFAAAQVKKVMEITHRLGGENLVFWGGREGYQSILNSDPKRELDHMAALFRMVVEYKKKLGASFQLLIEPKPREPMKHQYDYDAQTVIGFLKSYPPLAEHFKLNIEPNHTTLAGHDFEHDIIFASRFGMLGSIDSNTGDPLLGWDTDQFPMDVKKTTLVMKTVIEQNGLAPGGLNFDCKVRRESTDVEDLFIAHIGAMDAFASGLVQAAKIIEEGTLSRMVRERYSSFDSGLGKRIEDGVTSLEECEAFVKEHGEPKIQSGKQELFEMLFNRSLRH